MFCAVAARARVPRAAMLRHLGFAALVPCAPPPQAARKILEGESEDDEELVAGGPGMAGNRTMRKPISGDLLLVRALGLISIIFCHSILPIVSPEPDPPGRTTLCSHDCC